ncbi:MAG: TonB-dependent receptor [Thermaurantiacus sp.]
MKSVRAALVAAVSVSGLVAGNALAQTAATEPAFDEIIVTAQRQAQSLQDVPIAVSAFSAEALERQQINNPTQLQLTLPNVTFTKSNFTGASFTIRGVGDLCVGVSCDSATAIHVNDLPVFATRLFETEFFDLERVEVLRGPQGTLFGRNATSGVVNFITGRPDPSGIRANAEFGYGNYDEIRVQGMINLPLGDRAAVRVAGFYLKRDGYTENLFDGQRFDDRDMYAVRGSFRWEPTDRTTLDLMGYYFREDSNRLRIQKQTCLRDPTGVLGCLPAGRAFDVTNANSTFVGTLSSQEFLTIQGGAALGPALGALGLGSLYGPDAYRNAVNPADPRKVNTDFTPTYFADELQVQGRIEHDFGPVRLKLSGQYQRNKVDSQQDYNLSVQDRTLFAPGLNTLAAYAAGAGGPLLQLLAPAAGRLIPQGPNGPLCVSASEESGVGIFGASPIGFCDTTPQDFDRSNQKLDAWTGEAIIFSQLDGRFNFLLGAIYNEITLDENSYYVNAFGIDYISGILGGATTIGQVAGGNAGFPTVFLATPFFRNNTDLLKLKSWGIFGETYFDLADELKLTLGLRYNNDRKFVRARSTLASFPAPIGIGSAFDSPFVGAFDADPGTPGNQLWQERRVSFQEFTGRAVIDWQITPDNLLYFSYSRGYKSGGINPPLQPIFAVPETFDPEFIDAFEIGSKNRFLDGALQLNLTAFYYKYQGLQLSRIVARTSVNDNVDANIYGVEVEGLIRPDRNWLINLGFSALHTEVSTDKFLANPFDPSGGRSDVVIVKDITNGANCAVVPTGPGGAALANGYVAQVNQGIGASVGNPNLLRAPTAFPFNSGINGATAAFSICSVLEATAAAAGVQVLSPGVANNIRGNKLPQAPDFKASAGIQYTAEFDSGWSLVPRFDIALTGKSFGNIFNNNLTRIPSYYVMNAQVQLNGPDDRWFVRGYIQNIANNNAITGLYLTDQSSGNFTNIFTLEPRRFGVVAGVRF